MIKPLLLTSWLITCLYPAAARAEPARHSNVLGPLGLIVTPTARMDETGTVRAGIGTLDPYLHAHVGLQIADPLHIGIRQSAEISGLNDDARRLYPGIDVKLRLLAEGPYHPEIAVGWLGAVGHKRMAGEYLVASRRYENWDVSGGLGWGRLGSARQIGNPLGVFGSHFKKKRGLDGEEPNSPQDWFTGGDIGLFAGLEYTAPWINGLSFSAEWGADRYVAEKAAFDFDAPAPWALGVHYSPRPWIDFSTALVGGEKIMAALTLQNALSQWPGKTFRRDKRTREPLRPYRTGITEPPAMEQEAERGDLTLYNTAANATRAQTALEVPPELTTPRAIGLALPYISNHAGQTVEAIEVRPVYMGLSGPLIRMNRRNVTQALGHNAGSPQEIWRNLDFNPESTDELPLRGRSTGARGHRLRLILDQQFSLAEEDHGVLHRTAALIEGISSTGFGLLGGMGLRVNLTHNLDHLDEYRVPAALPVRGNVAAFADTRIALDRAYLGFARSPAPDLHIAVAAGYLEEMYGGIGGDILYRPFGSTWAVGAEGWLAFKRDPYTPWHTGLNGDRVFTGHLKAYYEFPGTNTTAEARLGRYLNEDVGGTLALGQRFGHGLNVRGFVTATGKSDNDVFGGSTNLYAGLELSLPVGNIPLAPQNSMVRVRAVPFGRDNGQTLESPVDLYTMSDPLSYRHIARHWNDIVD